MLLGVLSNCRVASMLCAWRKQRNAPGRLRAAFAAVPQRNEKGRWRIPTAAVTLHLPGHDADYRALDRVLAQFEDFCVVTQSVRQGIDVAVTVVDGDGRVLLGEESREAAGRSEEHTSELQSLMRISYAVFCLNKKNNRKYHNY